jgi:cytochrome bd-type quinol oxidase subunit 1
MTSWFHSIILATCAAATIAVGFASAAAYSDRDVPAAKKGDRLSAAVELTEARMTTVVDSQKGYSVITRVPIADAN